MRWLPRELFLPGYRCFAYPELRVPIQKVMAPIMTERLACKSDVRRTLLLLAITVMAVPSTRGQADGSQRGATVQADTAAKLPEYDVVSIKPNKSGSGSVDVESNIDRYAATNISLKGLLEDAYGIKKDLISGVQGPIESARFDVVAKIVEPDAAVIRKLTDRQRQSMLRPFLFERFQLKAHTEIKVLPVYDLVVVQSGPKFKQAAEDSKHDSGTSVHSSNRDTELTAHGIPMTSLASTLTGQVHRTVIDKTGLAGNYDLTMRWTSDNIVSAETDSGPSIFTALQEQLGLRLKPAKGPVETLVVDHVDMPSEN
jgi:uncharacterized protein (TIGR03435 family)